ncbi:hypothetical protein ACJX0J_018111, partial [Zea mays]
TLVQGIVGDTLTSHFFLKLSKFTDNICITIYNRLDKSVAEKKEPGKLTGAYGSNVLLLSLAPTTELNLVIIRRKRGLGLLNHVIIYIIVGLHSYLPGKNMWCRGGKPEEPAYAAIVFFTAGIHVMLEEERVYSSINRKHTFFLELWMILLEITDGVSVIWALALNFCLMHTHDFCLCLLGQFLIWVVQPFLPTIAIESFLFLLFMFFSSLQNL